MPSRSNRDLGFNRIVIGSDTALIHVEKSFCRQGLYIGVNIAVVASQCFCEGADACNRVPVNVPQEFHSLRGQNAGEGIPTLERQMALAERVATLGGCQASTNLRAASFSIAPPTVIFSSLIYDL